MQSHSYILTIQCPARLGIVAAVTGFLRDQQCNIEELAQFEDPATGQFFMRTVFVPGLDDFSKSLMN
ncbi:MAG: ACT domain-containing protein, partial [Pseudomonadota bacterium]